MRISVRDVQRGLKALGFDPGPVDGIYGTRTEAALTQWSAAWLDLSGTEVRVTNQGSEFDIRPEAAAQQLLQAARASASPRPSRGGAPIVETPSIPTGPFWRFNNPLAWAAAGGIALALGGTAYYGTKQGWFK